MNVWGNIGMEIDDILWARLAMTIDCEGSIMINKRTSSSIRLGRQYALRVNIYNTNFILVDWVQFHFGAHINVAANRSLKRKSEYVAYFLGKEAAEILRRTLPYLILKEEHALVGLEFQGTVHPNYSGTKFLTSEILDYRESLYLKMRELNRKGPR